MTPSDWFLGDHAPREEVHILLDTFSEEDGGPGMCMGVYSHLSVLTCTELISMYSHNSSLRSSQYVTSNEMHVAHQKPDFTH